MISNLTQQALDAVPTETMRKLQLIEQELHHVESVLLDKKAFVSAEIDCGGGLWLAWRMDSQRTFGLMVKDASTRCMGEPGVDYVPLISASARLRILAYCHLHTLLKKLTDTILAVPMPPVLTIDNDILPTAKNGHIAVYTVDGRLAGVPAKSCGTCRWKGITVGAQCPSCLNIFDRATHKEGT